MVHCLFEQSGTFKNEFRKLGINAIDYDILNDFNQTDMQIDLFDEINKAYIDTPSIFDNITNEDLIIAFFPCTRFEKQIQLWYRGDCYSQRNWDDLHKLEYVMSLHQELHNLYIYMQVILCVSKKRIKTGSRKSVFK